MPSINTETDRDLGADFDRLVDEIRTYDNARGLENQELTDNVQKLREEIQGLADFLARTPSPRETPRAPMTPTRPTVITTKSTPPPPQATPKARYNLTDRPVGGSDALSSIYPTSPRVMDVFISQHPVSALSRSTSNASSYVSYLSSHHSDDDLLDDVEEEESLLTPAPFPTESVFSESESRSVTSSSSMTSSPLSKSTELSTEASTARQEAPEVLERALHSIRDKLQDLEDGQNSTRNLLDIMKDRPIPVAEDHTAELADRLTRIELLIQSLTEREHPVGPVISVISERPERPATHEIREVAASITGSGVSISGDSDSLRRLRDILDTLAGPGEPDGPHMPTPMPTRFGPSIAQQLDEILSAGQHPLGAMVPPEVPRIDPFVYRPTGRPRSTSPASFESVPPRASTVPVIFPMPTVAPQVQRPPTTHRPPRARPESTATGSIIYQTVHDPGLQNAIRDLRLLQAEMAENDRQRQDQPPLVIPSQQGGSQQQPPRPVGESFKVGPGPVPGPVLVSFVVIYC